MSDDVAQTRATSSITMQVASASAPTPPQLTWRHPRAAPPPPPPPAGTGGAGTSVATRASTASCGNRACWSTPAAYGAILPRATARTASRRASWSSESRNRSKSVLLITGLPIGRRSLAGQLALEDLAGRGHRQRLDELDQAGGLVGRHVLPAPREQLGLGDLAAADDLRLDLLAEAVVRPADDRREGDGGVGEQHLLDLAGVHVEAAPDHHVLGPVD